LRPGETPWRPSCTSSGEANSTLRSALVVLVLLVPVSLAAVEAIETCPAPVIAADHARVLLAPDEWMDLTFHADVAQNASILWVTSGQHTHLEAGAERIATAYHEELNGVSHGTGGSTSWPSAGEAHVEGHGVVAPSFLCAGNGAGYGTFLTLAPGDVMHVVFAQTSDLPDESAIELPPGLVVDHVTRGPSLQLDEDTMRCGIAARATVGPVTTEHLEQCVAGATVSGHAIWNVMAGERTDADHVATWQKPGLSPFTFTSTQGYGGAGLYVLHVPRFVTTDNVGPQVGIFGVLADTS
jgi:hypothetical protein